MTGKLSDTQTFAADLGLQFIQLLDSLSALRSLVALGSGGDEETKLIQKALKVLIQNQDMDRCSVFLVEGEHLVNASGLGWDEVLEGKPSQSPQPLKFKIGEGIIGAAAQTRTIQHCRNCLEDPRFQIKAGQSHAVPGSLLCAPIEAEGELLGVLNISHPKPDFFSDWHERLLVIYCGILGQLICNNRLLRRMESKVRLRTCELETALGEARQLKAKYEHLSLRDDMTGLYNRRYFFPTAESLLARASRKREPVSLALLDLDHFKSINDRFGHGCGDLVLRQVGGMLQNAVRQSDILARFGGEEFIILMPDTDCQAGKQLAERIRQQIKTLKITYQDQPITISTSIGITCWPIDKGKPELEQMIRQADLALYRAKDLGRDRMVMMGEACGGGSIQS